MALPASFLDELRTRTPLSAVIGRRVKLARSGKQWKGCCPFHGEKTPSFYVYDDGYHCFGCGAHGDVITFVMQSQGLAFMEAVGQLAAEAGLEVPKPTPEAAEAERRRLDVVGVLEAVQVHYQRRLGLPEGRVGRDYLLGRGLTEETIIRFGLGWAGERGALTAELSRQGVDSEQLIDAGLLRRDEETGRTFELFSQRVMFPILDRRGTIISFGGRILGAGQPKYVNGPETAVFSKRRNLYGLNLARDGVRNGGTLIVVEGYMDVIATAQAGFTAAVAPLGTALTGEQLEELWRVSPTPVLCFDGDGAGARAASRVMELALPMLTPARSLRFATLPAGDDPDSLVRKGGPTAFQAVLDAAQSPSDALYDMVRGEIGDATPEKRAAFRTRLIETAGRIGDKALGAEYRGALLDRFFASRPRPAKNRGQQWDKRRPQLGVTSGPRIPRPVLHQDNATAERARILTAILLRHPFLLNDVAQAYNALPVDPPLIRLRDAIEHWAESAETLDSAGLMDHLTKSGFEHDVQHVLAAAPMPLPACASSDAMPAEAESGWWHIFGFLNVELLREEVALAEADAARNLTPETWRRQKALVEALAKIRSGEPDGVGAADV
ncbi:DNA primase [Acidisphaera sp. S103]|uniref:DNA primase n=1 Tax=Acidisphaera sp. S103 TaxID=1747223 RepID=UPI00131CDCC6|nr:DNA primase [Acidisphaera sp. S103]